MEMNRPPGRASLLRVLVPLFVISSTRGAEYIQSENTAPRSARKIETPVDAALAKDNQKIRRILLDELERRLEDQPPRLHDVVFDYNHRRI